MSVRSAAVALTTAAVVTFSVSASAAADHGHATTQAALDAAVKDEGAPGVLGQAEDGGGVWNGAAGVADRRTQRPRLAQDRFRIGSLTKPFVATVLLQLTAEGKVRLDEPVERWLPGIVRGAGNDGRRVTVRQLLGHTSGLYDYTADPRFQHAYFGRGFPRHRFRTHEPADLVHTAVMHPPAFAPGSGWRYSNTNYVLAGMIVRKVTGHSYAEEIERRIVAPLGLRQTSLPGHSARIPGPHGRAYSTFFSGRRGVPVHDVTALDPSLAGASGEMISSAGDLVRFFRALLGGRLLPQRQLAQMETTVAAEGDVRYGLGLTRRTLSCGTTVWGHEGTIQGSRSIALGTRDGAHTAAFNVNGDWAGDTKKLAEAEFCG